MSSVLPRRKAIADVLLEGRVRRGAGDPTRFPQQRMAALLGISLRQYQRWERGSSHPSARAVERIEEALSVQHDHADAAGLVERVASLQNEVRALRAELRDLRGRGA